MDKTVDFHIQDNIGFLGLNRPEKRNALNKQMIIEILSVLNEHKADRRFSVLVIYGEGGTFCSGADLEWMKEGALQSKTQNIEDAKLFNLLYREVYNFPTPVVCEVEKSAFGGAIGLLACADFVICEQDSTFGFPEVKLGLIPATIAPYVMNKMGNSNARKRMLMPVPFSSREAKEEGLVQFIALKNHLRDKTLQIAQNIALGAPEALIQTKTLIHNLQQNMEDETAFLHCARTIASARTSTEGQEGVKAFLEKRKPAWNNVAETVANATEINKR